MGSDVTENSQVSFLLATVIAGFAIQLTVQRYLFLSPENCLDFPLLFRALIVLFMVLRFFHGNFVWQKMTFSERCRESALTSGQKVFAHLSSYYVHIGQYILFIVAGHSIGNFELFVTLLMIISALDVAWALWSWTSEPHTILKKALLSWVAFNAITFMVCYIYFNVLLGNAPEVPLSLDIVLFLIYAMIGVMDYGWNRTLFFGIGE